MKETAVQVNNRKIRNGIRKQREVIEREQQKVWDRLTDTGPKTRTLKAGWTIEEAQDITDLIDQLTAQLTAEIIAESKK